MTIARVAPRPRAGNLNFPRPLSSRPAISPSILGLIGRTPLVRLNGLSRETGCEVLGKAEWLNPGGSVKDRAALFLVNHAEATGQLKPGGCVGGERGGADGGGW